MPEVRQPAKPNTFIPPSSRYDDAEGWERSDRRWREFCAEIDAEDAKKLSKELESIL